MSGERRYRASKLIGLETIPAYIRIANDQESLEMALVENIQRQDLDPPIEIALSYQRLMDEIELTQEKLSERVGKKKIYHYQLPTSVTPRPNYSNGYERRFFKYGPRQGLGQY